MLPFIKSLFLVVIVMCLSVAVQAEPYMQSTLDLKFAMNGHVRTGAHPACRGLIRLAEDDKRCGGETPSSDSQALASLDLSRIYFEAGSKSETIDSGALLEYYWAHHRPLERLQFFLLSKTFGRYTFGIQDSPFEDTLLPDLRYQRFRSLVDLPQIQDRSGAGRYFGRGFAPRDLSMAAFSPGVPRFGYTSLYLGSFRWGWTYGFEMADTRPAIEDLRHHLSASFSFERYNRETRLGFILGGAMATRLYRQTRQGENSAPFPISGSLSIRSYLKSFRLSMAATYNYNAVDSFLGAGRCERGPSSMSRHCKDSWGIGLGLGYQVFSKINVFLFSHYSQAFGVKRDLPDKPGTDHYMRVHLSGSYAFEEKMELFIDTYVSYDNVATSSSDKPTSLTFKVAGRADSYGLGLRTGLALRF